jgi:Pyruvate/2-oxoacid:ferredoxin oxidoreductase delta subunit
VSLNEPILRVLLYEGRGSAPLDAEERFALLAALLENGFPVSRPIAETGIPAPDHGPWAVVGRFTEPPLATPDRAEGVFWQPLDGLGAGDLAARLREQRQRLGATPAGAWKPWFPVIDPDRCTHCMQCLSFCLFGVYGADADKHLQVEHPDQCKTNCPACSRVCPEAAIMFPKYKAGPINGEVVTDADLQREKMKIDISALLGGDVYALLRARSERAKSRFSKERDADKALAERQKCLSQLAADVPPEVLMSLPSPEEIARRAEEAAARARAVLQS